MDVQIKTDSYEHVNISDYEDGIWLSIWHPKAHAGVPMTREQATQLRDELTKYLENQHA